MLAVNIQCVCGNAFWDGTLHKSEHAVIPTALILIFEDIIIILAIWNNLHVKSKLMILGIPGRQLIGFAMRLKWMFV